VAVVLEYLRWMGKNRRVPEAKKEDDRLALLEENALYDGESGHAENALVEDMQKRIELFLKDKTKTQLDDIMVEYKYEGVPRNLNAHKV
jgi:hypothetical protein